MYHDHALWAPNFLFPELLEMYGQTSSTMFPTTRVNLLSGTNPEPFASCVF